MDWKEVDRRHEALEQERRREEAVLAAEAAEAQARHDARKAANLTDIDEQTARFRSLMAGVGDPDLSRFIFNDVIRELRSDLQATRHTYSKLSRFRAQRARWRAHRALRRKSQWGWRTGRVLLGDYEGSGDRELVVLMTGQAVMADPYVSLDLPSLPPIRDVQEISPLDEKWLDRLDAPERVAECLVGTLRRHGIRIS